MTSEFPANATLIQHALDFAARHHRMQFRKTTSIPYLTHLFDVLKRVESWGITNVGHPDIWVLSLLHDTVEDTEATLEDIRREFGPKTAEWVSHMTFREINYGEKPHEYQEAKTAHLDSFGQKPIEVLVTKAADRICNVYDFLQSDPRYAGKYLKRASGLFMWAGQRQQEIMDVFGIEVLSKINADIQRMMETVSTTGV